MPDTDVLAALGASVVRPPFLAYLDIVGDPLRATTWETSIQPSGTGDPDLDGHLFSAIDPKFATIGEVTRSNGGTETVTASLSGIVGPDSDLLNLLGDETKWKGRLARLWFMLLDEDRHRIGGVVPYYVGRMVAMAIKGSATSQRAEVTIESYLVSLSAPSQRTYLDQADFDPSDTSAGLTVTVANGAKKAAGVSGMITYDPYSGDR